MSFININLPDTKFSYKVGDIVYYYFKSDSGDPDFPNYVIGNGEVKSINLDLQEVTIADNIIPINKGYLFTTDNIIGERWINYALERFNKNNSLSNLQLGSLGSKKDSDSPDSVQV